MWQQTSTSRGHIPVGEYGVKDLDSGDTEEHHPDQEHLGHDPELLVEVVGAGLDQPDLQHKCDAQTYRSKHVGKMGIHLM